MIKVFKMNSKYSMRVIKKKIYKMKIKYFIYFNFSQFFSVPELLISISAHVNRYAKGERNEIRRSRGCCSHLRGRKN